MCDMPIALTSTNIHSGFRKTGIFPFNRNLFTELDFAPSFVTVRPPPENAIGVEVLMPHSLPTVDQPLPLPSQAEIQQRDILVPEETVPGRRSINGQQSSPSRPCASAPALLSSGAIVFSPEIVLPLPKALARKSNRGRKKRKSTIYTDTPEKNQIQKKHEAKVKKQKEVKQVKKKIGRC